MLTSLCGVAYGIEHWRNNEAQLKIVSVEKDCSIIYLPVIDHLQHGKCLCMSLFVYVCVFEPNSAQVICGIRDETQGLTFAKHIFYHLSHVPGPVVGV